jgi:hypothetical protein
LRKPDEKLKENKAAVDVLRPSIHYGLIFLYAPGSLNKEREEPAPGRD